MSYGACRYEVVAAPTEVVNTGHSEVLGSVILIVRGTGNFTGTFTGDAAQIGIMYEVQIDNTTTAGIRVFFSSGFAKAAPSIVSVENVPIDGRLKGLITLNLLPGATPADGDFIRIEGVRGRIASSVAITPGNAIFAQLQSIDDPSVSFFDPDTIRVAKSLDGLDVWISCATLQLDFPSTGVPPNGTTIPTGQSIRITEGFARAFVAIDSGNNNPDRTTYRVDSAGKLLGAPTNSTGFVIFLEGIPESVSEIEWPSTSTADPTTGAVLALVSSSAITSGVASAIYSFETTNQTTLSDKRIESFEIQPVIRLKTNSAVVGTILAAATLAPILPELPWNLPPTSNSVNRPRFLQMFESDEIATNNPPDDPTRAYASCIRAVRATV
jgi:hypothetical protein